MHSGHLLPVSFLEGCHFRERPLRVGPLCPSVADNISFSLASAMCKLILRDAIARETALRGLSAAFS